MAGQGHLSTRGANLSETDPVSLLILRVHFIEADELVFTQDETRIVAVIEAEQLTSWTKRRIGCAVVIDAESCPCQALRKITVMEPPFDLRDVFPAVELCLRHVLGPLQITFGLHLK